MSEQEELNDSQEDQSVKIVITYKPGSLELFVDGKSHPVEQIKGDFSTWEPCHLVLGNEWKEKCPWTGRIHEFSIYSSMLSPEESILLSK